MDTVEAGPDNANETQTLRVQATGGSYVLEFGEEVTAPIPYNASAQVVEQKLNELASIGGVGGAVGVTGGPGDASGSTPYLISFGGVQGGVNQPLIEQNDELLEGPGAGAFVATSNPGATGFEVCEPNAGDICKNATEVLPDVNLGGGVSGPGSLSIDQGSGDFFLSNTRHGINRYSATGRFLGSIGYDTVSVGPNDSSVDEKLRMTVTAAGGAFNFVIGLGGGFGQQTSAPIPYNAPASVVAEKINDIQGLQELRATVSVTGGPGDETGSQPYILTFGGTFAGDEVTGKLANSGQGNTFVSATGLEGSPKTAKLVVIQQGGAPEICTPAMSVKRTSRLPSQVVPFRVAALSIWRRSEPKRRQHIGERPGRLHRQPGSPDCGVHTSRNLRADVWLGRGGQRA